MGAYSVRPVSAASCEEAYRQNDRRLQEGICRVFHRLEFFLLRAPDALAENLKSPAVAELLSWIERLRADPYQVPVLAIDAQGSAGALASPFWSSSMEMPSGDFTKAMRPSRGGRLMVTPLAIRSAQNA